MLLINIFECILYTHWFFIKSHPCTNLAVESSSTVNDTTSTKNTTVEENTTSNANNIANKRPRLSNGDNDEGESSTAHNDNNNNQQQQMMAMNETTSSSQPDSFNSWSSSCGNCIFCKMPRCERCFICVSMDEEEKGGEERRCCLRKVSMVFCMLRDTFLVHMKIRALWICFCI